MGKHTEQPTLFDEIEIEEKSEKKNQKEIRNDEELDKWAFLYTATAMGNNSGIHFMMTLEDARKWCSSELSRGCLHGTEWAYFFTSVKNFVNFHCWGMDSEYRTNKKWGVIDLRHYVDNGKWDEKIALRSPPTKKGSRVIRATSYIIPKRFRKCKDILK